jgi:hypothetical protein
MAFEVKFGYISGFNLAFSCYQPDGTGRGIAQQPLPELNKGYYGGTPLTELVAGDKVIANALDNVIWESARVYVLTERSYVYWQGGRVYYEGNWVADYGTSEY